MALANTLYGLLESQEAATGIDSYKFITEVEKANEENSKAVVSVFKQAIKSSPSPVVKLRALILLHRCVVKSNKQILAAVTESLLNRLLKLARWKKESTNDRRGEDMFGAASLASFEARAASANFLTTLLSSLRQWAQHFSRSSDRHPTEFLLAYEKLLNEGVVFPSEDVRPQSQQKKKTTIDLDSVHRSMDTMESLLVATAPDRRSLARVADTLIQQSNRLQQALEEPTSLPSDVVQDYLDTSEAIRELRSRYEQVQKTRDDLIDVTYGRTNTRFMQGFAELGRREEIIEEIEKTESRTVGVTAEIEGMEEEIREMNNRRELIAAREAEVRKRIDELQARSKRKDETIESLRRDIVLLQDRVQGNIQPQPVASYCSSVELRSAWYRTDGVLLKHQYLQVAFRLRSKGRDFTLSLRVRNDSGRRILGLWTKLNYKSGEGFEASIDREEEEMPLEPGDFVERTITAEITAFFPGVPTLGVGDSTRAQFLVFLPLTVFRVLEATYIDPGELISLWAGLTSPKATQQFLSLHVGNSARALAEELRATGKMQIFTLTEMPALSDKVLFASAHSGTESVIIKAKVADSGGAFTVKSSSERLRDCVMTVIARAVVSQLSR